MYQHARSKQLYTEVREGPEHLSRSRWSLQAKSATTGRWVWVLKDRVREYRPPGMVEASRDEALRWARREELLEMAWRLSRQLPYNLGVAVTNIAVSEYEGNLGVASAALRDEMERLTPRVDATTVPEEDNE